jgi:hypothetical protein
MDENINKFGYGKQDGRNLSTRKEPVNLAQRIMGQDLKMF